MEICRFPSKYDGRAREFFRKPGPVSKVRLSLSPATRVFVALAPVDMRKSFNGLYTYAQEVLQQSPTTGHLFVFTNKLRHRLKILLWEGSGLWVCAKRLEQGAFAWSQGEGTSRSLRPEELQLLIHGLEGTPRAHWYRSA